MIAYRCYSNMRLAALQSKGDCNINIREFIRLHRGAELRLKMR